MIEKPSNEDRKFGEAKEDWRSLLKLPSVDLSSEANVSAIRGEYQKREELRKLEEFPPSDDLIYRIDRDKLLGEMNEIEHRFKVMSLKENLKSLRRVS